MQKCKNIDCVKTVQGNRLYCSLKCRSYYYNKYLRDYSKNSVGLKVKHNSWAERECLFCFKNFNCTKQSSRKFCNRSCAASFNNTIKIRKPWDEISKQKQSVKSKDIWLSPEYLKKQLAKPLRFNSKKELEIKTFLQNKFPEDNWTSGGALKFENEVLVRDIFSKKLKICIEYDGVWHFKDIKGQLQRKQLKDKLLEQWCLKNNYRLIRIDEEYNFTNEELISLIYNDKSPIIKLGNRYLHKNFL